MREGKRSYFTNYFQNNLNDLKSTWKGIKKLISLKQLFTHLTKKDSQCFQEIFCERGY